MFLTDIKDLHKRSFSEFLLLCLDSKTGLLKTPTENRLKINTRPSNTV